MSNVLVRESSLQSIADAIRAKNGTQDTYKPDEMADAIEAISGGGITPTGTININQNGTHDVTSYASANVNVPTGSTPVINPLSVTENGTYTAPSGVDGYSPITVNVPQGVTPTGTKQISITENGTTTEDVSNYANAEIEVNVSGGGGTDLSGAVLDGSISGAYENSDITTLRTHALDACSSLTSVSFPNVISVGANALYNCKNVTSVNFPKLKGGGALYAFAGMEKLTSVSLPSMTSTLANFMFNNCKLLKTADIGVGCLSLGGQTFAGCTVLDTVILRRTAGVVSCNNNTFNNTTFASGGTGGTVYVPSALIESYKAASNWSTLYNAGTCTFVALEGSAYE